MIGILLGKDAPELVGIGHRAAQGARYVYVCADSIYRRVQAEDQKQCIFVLSSNNRQPKAAAFSLAAVTNIRLQLSAICARSL